MIYGIGTDMVAVKRMATLHERHGERALEKLLGPSERSACRAVALPARFLAKRFAAKEAFGKALGTGIRAPALLPAIEILHDSLGRPLFKFEAELAAYLSDRRLIAHLSISDEEDYSIAFVVLEENS